MKKRVFQMGLLTTFLCLGAVGPASGQTAEPDTATVRKVPRVPWIKDKSWTEIVELAQITTSPCSSISPPTGAAPAGCWT